MLNPALCHRPVSQWLEIKSAIAHWLMTPILVVLPLLFLIFLPWIIPRFRWKRLWSGFGTLLLVTYFSAQFPLTTAAANKGLVAFVPPDRGQTADAIVVLGRGEAFRNSRVEVAANLWESQRAPLIFASGSGDGSEIVNQLERIGIPSQALEEEHCSQTTKENALFTASVLQPQGIKKIILVTDPPHMLRSLLTFRNVGFEVIPHKSPAPHLTQTRKAMMMFYEYMGLVKYGLKGEFVPQNMAKQEQPQIIGQRLEVRS
ncbi:MAG: YdcF family protein [Rivularia sp. (in: cyanobacteria)]